MPDRTYTDAEVREILRRAVERGNVSGGLAREDLVAAAQDAGISASAVEIAIGELDGERDLNEEVAKLQRERRHEATSSVATWAIVNTGLFAIDWANGGGWWFYWPLCTWGLFVGLKLKAALLPNPAHERQEAERRLARRQRQYERELAEIRRREAELRKRARGGLDGVIERGVEDIFDAAARRIGGKRIAVEPTEDDGGTSEHTAEPRRGARSER
jgi:hypothetical protein